MADIFVIDDDDMMVELMSGLLTDQGHKVRSAPEGVAGLDAVSRAVPDLVIVDMNMPGLDGYQVAKRLRADPKTKALRILAVTAHSAAADYDAAYEAGCDAFVAKPLDSANLLKAVDGLLKDR